MTVDCPVCGWTPDDPGEKTDEELRNSVIAHMSSNKGEHEGIGFQKAKQMVWADEQVNGTADSGPDNGSGVDVGDEPDDLEVDDTDNAAETADPDSGLGLSGSNPFDSPDSPDHDPDPDPAEESTDPDPDSTESGTGIALVGAVAAIGLAAIGAIRGRAANSQQTDGPNVV